MVPCMQVETLPLLDPWLPTVLPNGMGSSWSAVGSGVNSFVNTIGISSTDEIYIGGGFDLAYNVGVVNYIAKWNGSAWQSVGGGVGPVTGTVYSIVFRGSDMYVGGVFTQARNSAGE